MKAWSSLLLTVLGLVLTAAPAFAQDAYTFSWWSADEACTPSSFDPPVRAHGYGLAVVTPRPSGGWLLRFAGPGGAGFVETDASNFPLDISLPGACGSFTEFTTLSFLTSQSDQRAGVKIATQQNSGSIRHEAFGAGSKVQVGAQFDVPAEGATVSGTTSVRASVKNVIAGVPLVYRLSVDGREVSVVNGTAPSLSTGLNTTTISNGSHRLDLMVSDKFGTNLASATRTVTVSNGGSTTPPPGSLKVVLTSPPANGTVKGTVAVNIWVEGASAGTTTFTLAVDGKTSVTQSCACAHVWPGWNTTTSPNGAHTLTATVRDSAGKTGSATITVIVGN